MRIEPFFDKRTWTMTYVVWDEKSKDAVVIDSVWDYDPKASKTWTESVDQVIKYLKDQKLNLKYILETHAHADHLSASSLLQKAFPGTKVAIGEKIKVVQATFKKIFNFGDEFKADGSQFDTLLKDGETLKAGSLSIKMIETPGHTPACGSYLIEDAVFTGDAMFMPDYGTGRCDFPAGSAEDLYDSITNKLFALPDNTRVFVGHDYMPGGRKLAFESTIGEEKERNIHLRKGVSKEEFVKMRKTRDATLEAPNLLLPSVQVNANGGHLNAPEKNGLSYIKIPITAK